jgi:hypothetical protein
MLDRRTDKILADIDVSYSSVHKTLSGLDVSKSVGPDGIQNLVLRNCAGGLSLPLSILFRKSLAEGSLPKDWKIAHVSPIFKNKGSRSDPNQYRPISLTSCVGKVLERLVNDSLLKHLQCNNLISSRQFGFLPKHSTTDQLIFLLHEMFAALDNKQSVIACFLDLASAFDTVPHAAIRHKLLAYGIRGILYRWICDYLQGRSQAVVVDGFTSNWRDVQSGVPQGSVIAPTLFLIFINDICESLQVNALISYGDCVNDNLIYADDTMLYCIGSNSYLQRISMNRDLRNISRWAKTWGMAFNPSKTEALFISKNEPCPDQLLFQGHKVPYVATHKHLGFILSKDLSFGPHVDAVCRKGAAQIFLLKRLSYKTSNRNILRDVYTKYILPYFEYACPAWAPLYQMHQNRLEALQRRAIRIILGYPYMQPLQQYDYELLSLQTLKARRNVAAATYAFRLFNGHLPERLIQLQPRIRPHREGARTRTLYFPKVTYPTSRWLDQSPILFSVKLLNCLPHDLWILRSSDRFKQLVWQNHFHSIILVDF